MDDLTNEPTEAVIRAVLNDDKTSGAILWLTPDVEDSAIIKEVEVPEAVRRYRRDSNFWLVIVLANGLNYADVTTIFANTLGAEELSTWNLTKVSDPWASPTDTVQVANTALRQRVKSFFAQFPSSPIAEVAIHAKGTMAYGSGDVLAVDWTRHFKSGAPNSQAWTAMSEAAENVAIALKQLAPSNTAVYVGGTLSLAAAMLLGSSYSGRDGRNPVWLQRQPDGHTMTPWRITDAFDASIAEQCGWKASPPIYRMTSARALAVCINISDNISEAFARSHSVTPDWRAVLEIGSPAGRNTRADPLSPGEVASLVHLTIDAIRTTRSQVLGIDSIHFFIAGPAGFAFLLGTCLATLPIITTYEYDTVATSYTPAASFSS
ncbi:SAVED domain-containing protein [Arthrobacter sp. EH-1B-1]|uniref:SAVED domain-containing protein n=1 Tax=Arthrobacter vasquezii TaxID=2977629 RepID=A0ABT6CXW6_9MICC|nr:SAVED domain-containing protein [Arthrobacter vasquezii]MDF9278430.1 SAVED domain-containing protein [Arthrobacter vasquezii]